MGSCEVDENRGQSAYSHIDDPGKQVKINRCSDRVTLYPNGIFGIAE